MPWKPREPLPVAGKAKRGQRTVRPSALEGAKLGLYRAMTARGIKKAALARRLGWHMPQVDRLFNLRHPSRLDQIEAAALVLGRRLRCELPELAVNRRQAGPPYVRPLRVQTSGAGSLGGMH
jgi:hypothetical protein